MIDSPSLDDRDRQTWYQVTAGLLRERAWDCIDPEALAAVIDHLEMHAGGPDVAANRALYAQDLARWGQATAALLRAGQHEQVDPGPFNSRMAPPFVKGAGGISPGIRAANPPSPPLQRGEWRPKQKTE